MTRSPAVSQHKYNTNAYQRYCQDVNENVSEIPTATIPEASSHPSCMPETEAAPLTRTMSLRSSATLCTLNHAAGLGKVCQKAVLGK